MNPRAAGLLRSIRFRLDALQTRIEELQSQVPVDREGSQLALALTNLYPDWMRRYVDANLSKDDAALTALLAHAARDISFKAYLIEAWFSHGSIRDLPSALSAAIEAESELLNLPRRHAVLAIGSPGNFATLPLDLRDYLFGEVRSFWAEPENLGDDRFVMMQVPRVEGGAGLWWPVMVGHEIAHLKARTEDTAKHLRVGARVDWTEFGLTSIQRDFYADVAEAWATELICDAYSVFRYGPAGVVAMVEFLDQVGATNRYTVTHPPGWLRFRLMRGWLGNAENLITKAALEHCDAIAPSAVNSVQPGFPELTRLPDQLVRFKDEFFEAVGQWGATQYHADLRDRVVRAAVDDLDRGVPPRDDITSREGIDTSDLTEQDAVNASWVHWSKTSWWSADRWPYERLLLKCLDSLSLLRRSGKAGVDPPGTSALPGEAGGPAPQAPQAPPVQSGVLSAPALSTRLALGWHQTHPLIVTPRLSSAVDKASVDVRLGNRFIVFQRTGTPSITTFDPSWDAREVQRVIEVGWGQRFVLHPQELVLASTLEYIQMPADLAAQVITRSTYGRMGLITATAVQVHPHFNGCLTLELVNLGLVPLRIAPGERIAQLVFTTVSPPVLGSPERTCPTGPELSRARANLTEDAPLRRLLGIVDP